MVERVLNQITAFWNEIAKTRNASDVVYPKVFGNMPREKLKRIISGTIAAKETNGLFAAEMDKELSALQQLIPQNESNESERLSSDDEDFLIDIVSRKFLMCRQSLEVLEDGSSRQLSYTRTQNAWNEICEGVINLEPQMTNFIQMNLAATKAIGKLDEAFDQLHRVQKNADHFTALPNECIYEILKHLPLDDLCAVSRSCQSLKVLSENHFHMRYPQLLSKTVNIRKLQNGKIGFGALCDDRPQQWIECFSQQLQKITLWFPETEMNDELLQFLQTNCSDNIKEIMFIGSKYSKSFEKGINAFLKNVETIRITCRGDGSGMRLDVVLNDLLLLKHLEFFYVGKFSKIKGWKRVNCTQLESMTCHFCGTTIKTKLKRFLQQNPSVKRFTCNVHRPSTAMMKQVLTAVTKSVNIEELIIEVDDIDFALIRNQLQCLDERKNFKRFGLRVSSSWIRKSFELASMKSFSFLSLHHNQRFFGMEHHFAAVSQMVSLEVLELNGHFCINKLIAADLSKNLTHLKRLILFEVELLSDVCKSFASNARQLIEIELRLCRFDKQELLSNVPMMIDERKKLENAAKLVITIYSDADTIPNAWRNNKIFSKENEPNDDLVEVKLI